MADPDEKRASLVADGALGLAELSRKRENVTKCKPQLEARLARLEELQAELQDRVQQVEAAEKELDQLPRLNEIDKRLAGLESRDVTAQSGASPEEQITTNEPESSRQIKEEKQRGRKSSKLSTMCFKGEKDKENTDFQQDIPRNQVPPEQLQKKESIQKSPKNVSKSKLCARNKQTEEDEEPQQKTCFPKQKPKKGYTAVNNDEHEDVNNQVIPSDEGVDQRLSDNPGDGEQLQHSAEETSGPLPEPEAEKLSPEHPPTADTQGEAVPKQQPAADVPCHCKTPPDQQAEQVPIESPSTDDIPSEGASKQLPAAEDSCDCDTPTDQQAKQVPMEPPPTADTPGERVLKQPPAAEDSCDCDIPTDQQAERVPIKPPPTDDTPSEGVSKQLPAAEDSDIPTDQEAKEVPIKPLQIDIPDEGVSKQQPAAEDSCDCYTPTDQQEKQVPMEPPPTADTPDEGVSKQQPAAEDSCDCDTPTDQEKQVPMEPLPTADSRGESVLKQQPAGEDSCDCKVPTNQQANQVPIEPPPTVDTPCEGVTKQKIAVKDSCDCKTPNKQAKQVPIESPPTADTPCEGVTKQLPAAQDSCECKIPTNKQAKQVPIEPPPTAGTPCKGLSNQIPPSENACEIPDDHETQQVLLEPPPTSGIPCKEAIPKIPPSQCMPDKNQPSPGTCGKMDGIICSCGCGSVIPALPRMGKSSCGCSFQSPDVETKAKTKRVSRASRRTTAEPRAQSRRSSPNSQRKVPRRGFAPDASHCEPDRVQNLPPRTPPNVAPQQCPTSPVESAFTPDLFDCGGRFPRPQAMSGTPMSVDTNQRMPYGAPMQHDCIGNTDTFQRQSFAPTGTANQSRYPRRSNRDSRAFSKSRPQTMPEPSRSSTQVRRSTYRRSAFTQDGRPAVPSDCGSPQGPQSNHVASQDVPLDFARCSANHDRSTQTPTVEHRSLETCGTKCRSQSLPAFEPTHPQTSNVASFSEPTSETPSSLPSGACSIGTVPQRSSVAPRNERPCAREVPMSFSDNFVGPIDTQFPQDRGPSENTCRSSCYSKRPDRSQSLSTSPTPEVSPAAIGSPSSSTGPDHSQDNPSPPIDVSDSPLSSFNNSLIDSKQTQPLQTPTSPCTPCRNKPPETCNVSTSFSNPMMYPPQSQNGGPPLDSDLFQESPKISRGVGAPPLGDPGATEQSLSPDTKSVSSPQYSEATSSPWEPTADPRPVRPCAPRSQSMDPSGLPSPYTRSSSLAPYGRSFQGSMPCASPAPRQSAMPFAGSNASMYNVRLSPCAPVSPRPPSASRQANGRSRVASAAPCRQPSVDPRATETSAAPLLPCPVTPVTSVQQVPFIRPLNNSTSGSYSRESRSPSGSTYVNPTSCRPGFSNEGLSDNYQPDKWGSNSGSPSGQPPMQSQYQRPSASQNPCASTCGSPMDQRTPYGSAYPRDVCPSLAVPENHAPDGTFSCSHQCPAVAGSAPCPSLSTPVPEDFLIESPRPVPEWFDRPYTPRCSQRNQSVRPYWYSNNHHPRCPNKLNTGLSSRTRQTQGRCMPPRQRRPFP